LEDFTSVITSNHNIKLLVPSRNKDWYAERGYEPLSAGIFKSSARGVDLVIDIGAHVGFYSLLASRANPGIPIIAIEGSRDNFRLLQQNISNAGARNIKALHGVFGITTDTKRFLITEASDNCGLTGHINSPTIEIENVKGINGESLEISDGLKVLIKIDVEGHELEALQSLRKIIIGSISPRILVEINPKMISYAGYRTSSLIKLLHSFGLRIFLVDDKTSTWKEISQRNKNLDREIKDGYMNLYCVKKSSAISLLSFLHSGNLGGAENSHCEFASNHIANGGMVSTYVHGGNFQIESKIINNGSSFHKSNILNSWWDPDYKFQNIVDLNDHYFNRKSTKEFAKNLRNKGFDLALSQTSASPVGAQVAKSLGLPHIWWIREFGDLDHNLAYPLPINELGELYLKYSELVLTNSMSVLKHFYPYGHDRVFVSRPYPKTDLVDSPQSTAGSKVFAIIGNINPSKGHETVLRAIQLCNSVGGEIKLKIIGKDHINYIKNLKLIALDLGIQQDVFFEDETLDLKKIYSGLAGVIVASNSEAFGRIPFEATAFQIPVLYSKSGGFLEYMKDGFTGLGFDPGDAQMLAQKINIVTHNKELVKRLVVNARTELFNEQEESEAAQKLYARFLNIKKKEWRAKFKC